MIIEYLCDVLRSRRSLKKTVKTSISLIYWSVETVFRAFGRLAGRALRGRMTILYYHGVPADATLHFARQMDLLKRHAVPVSADYEGPLQPGRLHVAVTFDDAFVSVLENALPEVEAHGIPVTIFVPGGMLGRHPAWEFNENSNDRADIVMTEDQLRRLPETWVKVGSHSLRAPRLPNLDGVDLKNEVDGSRSVLERILGRPVDLFSFPYGAHNDRVVNACRSAGYKKVFSILPASVHPQRTEFIRGRVAVDPRDSHLDFILKMNGAYSWMPFASAIKSRFIRKRSTLTALASKRDRAVSRRPNPN